MRVNEDTPKYWQELEKRPAYVDYDIEWATISKSKVDGGIVRICLLFRNINHALLMILKVSICHIHPDYVGLFATGSH